MNADRAHGPPPPGRGDSGYARAVGVVFARVPAKGPRMSSSEPLSPDEIEQRQPATPVDDEDGLDDVREPLTPDEIEQRQVAGWDDEEEPIADDEA